MLLAVPLLLRASVLLTAIRYSLWAQTLIVAIFIAATATALRTTASSDFMVGALRFAARAAIAVALMHPTAAFGFAEGDVSIYEKKTGGEPLGTWLFFRLASNG